MNFLITGFGVKTGLQIQITYVFLKWNTQSLRGGGGEGNCTKVFPVIYVTDLISGLENEKYSDGRDVNYSWEN